MFSRQPKYLIHIKKDISPISDGMWSMAKKWYGEEEKKSWKCGI